VVPEPSRQKEIIMHDSKSQPGPSSVSGLETRIERIRQNLATQQARLARGSMLTASVGAILCALMAFWFYYGYVKIQEVMTPKVIVQAAESKVMEALPNARIELEKKINASADDWAADFSKQAQANVPELRQQLEQFIVSKATEALDQFQVLSASQFRGFVQANQPMLADGFRSLKKSDEADRFVSDLHAAVETQLSTDMRSQAEEMLHTLIDLNSKLDMLSKGEKINHEQALEREILMIARRLQLDTQSNEPPGDKSAADRPVAKRRARKASSSEAGAEAAAGSADGGEPGSKDTEGTAPIPGDSSAKE
jgi:hypothetical protein